MDFKKRLVVFGVVFLLVLSTLVYADDSSDNCAGFWGAVKCFLWGDSSNRAGQSWWDRSEG